MLELRSKSVPCLLLGGLFAGSIITACGPSPDEGNCLSGVDCTPLEVSPTPSPTPPQSYEDYYRITEVVILDCDTVTEETCLEDVLDVIVQTVYDAAEEAVCGEETCTREQMQVLSAIERFLDELLSVESLNESFQDPIQSFDRNYVLEFEFDEGSSQVTMTWHSSGFASAGFTPDEVIFTVTATLDANNCATFGPSDIPFTIELSSDSGEGPVLSTTLTLAGSYLSTCFDDEDHLQEMSLVGGLRLDEMLELTAQVLTAVEEMLPGEDSIHDEEVLASLEADLTPLLDYDSDGDGADDSFAVEMVLTGGHIVPVE